MPVTARVQIEGMDEVRKSFRKLGGPELVRQLGQVHKRIGEIVISRAGGASTGVGAGAGATIRPSARTKDVVLLVGGRHRSHVKNPGKGFDWRQWGVVQIFPPPGHRPYLIGAAISSQDEIYSAYLDGVQAVADMPLTRS
jgi:hypothetical protein